VSDDIELSVVEAPTSDDIAALIAGLTEHRRSAVGVEDDTRPVGVFARRDGRIVAGADGRTQWGWLYVAHVWVDDSLRGTGMGTRVLTAIEDAARARGCRAAFLDTFSFQAAPFYEKLGYREFGRLEGFGANGTKHFLWKEL
jgi:GNAT superfamily N-acetyltransferase